MSSNDPSGFPAKVFVRYPDEEKWRLLCVVWDDDALGIIEAGILRDIDMEVMTQKVLQTDFFVPT